MLKAHMNLKDEKLNEDLVLPNNKKEFLEKFQNKTISGVIKSV